MIRSFATKGTKGTKDIFDGRDTKHARQTCPKEIWENAKRKLDQVNQSEELLDLRAPPGNYLEKLKGDRQGFHSIRINDRYRICFRWTAEGPEDVEIVDYHR